MDHSVSSKGDMLERMQTLERRMVRLEELSNRQFQDIGHLTQQVAQLRVENDQLKQNGLITVANTSTITTAAAAYTPPFNSPAEGGTVDNHHAVTTTNTAVSSLDEREEVWSRIKESRKDRIQVVYDSSDMQHANYQYPGTFEQQLHRPMCWRSDRPIPTSLVRLAPAESASRLLLLAKELRMQIWIRAIGAEATLGINWDHRGLIKPREELTQVPGDELPRLRLTCSIINEDLRGYAKPMVTLTFMETFNMYLHLIHIEKHLRSRISIIKVRSYDMEHSNGTVRTIMADRGLGSNATSIYGVQEYYVEERVRYDILLSRLFKRLSVMSIDMHRVVLDKHEERYDGPGTPFKEFWVLHSTFRVRRPYAVGESPHR